VPNFRPDRIGVDRIGGNGGSRATEEDADEGRDEKVPPAAIAPFEPLVEIVEMAIARSHGILLMF